MNSFGLKAPRCVRGYTADSQNGDSSNCGNTACSRPCWIASEATSVGRHTTPACSQAKSRSRCTELLISIGFRSSVVISSSPPSRAR